MHPVAEHRHILLELIAASIADAIQYLKKHLPPGGPVALEVISLEGRMNAVNKERLFGTISDNALQLEYNKIRKALLELVNNLQEEDFQTVEKPTNQKPGKKRGSILYRIPTTMETGVENKCVVRIALDVEAIVENFQLDEHVKLDTIRVSDIMMVELMDPSDVHPFEIRGLNSAEQFIEPDEYTEWIFMVKPLLEGRFPLMIKVSIIELIHGKERKRDIVLEEMILIVTEASDEIEEAAFKPSGYTLNLGGAEEEKRERKGAAGPPLSKRRRSRLRASSMVAVLLLIMGFGAFAFPETRDWLWAKLRHRIETYQTFADKYELSAYREEAIWRKTALLDTPPAYLEYLATYPVGKYRSEALDRLAQLEQGLFKRIEAAGELEDLLYYFSWFPDGANRQTVVDSSLQYQLHQESRQATDIDSLSYPERQDAFWRFVEAHRNRLPEGIYCLEYTLLGQKTRAEYHCRRAQAAAEQRQAQAENSLWAKVQADSKPIHYLRYLERFPIGTHRDTSIAILRAARIPIPSAILSYRNSEPELESSRLNEEPEPPAPAVVPRYAGPVGIRTVQTPVLLITDLLEVDEEAIPLRMYSYRRGIPFLPPSEFEDPSNRLFREAILSKDAAIRAALRADSLLWAQAQVANTAQSYGDYLAAFPEGLFSEPAYKLSDRRAWEEAKDEHTEFAYRNYFIHYREGKYVRKAKKRADRNAWKKAKENDTPPMYGGYIFRYSDGKHVAQAFRRANRLLNQKEQLAKSSKGQSGSTAAGGPTLTARSGSTKARSSSKKSSAGSKKSKRSGSGRFLGINWPRIQFPRINIPLPSFGRSPAVKADLAAWKRARESNTISAYLDYQRRYTKHAEKAMRRAQALAWQYAKETDTEKSYRDYASNWGGKHSREAMRRADTRAWESAERQDTEKGYRSYVFRYPEGRYRKQGVRAAGAKNWESATGKDSMYYYQRYLRIYPEGKFVVDAQLRYEELLWDSLKSLGTVAALEEYRTQYPEGGFAEEIASLQDDWTFEAARDSGSVEAYLDYLQQFPQGVHAREADQRIWVAALVRGDLEAIEEYVDDLPEGRFRREAQRSFEELQVWREAESVGTLEALQAYRAAYPNGKYLTRALHEQEDVTWKGAAEIGSITSFEEYLRHYPEGVYSLEADAEIWRQTQQLGTRSAYQRYLSLPGDRPYATTAKEKMEELPPEEEPEEENDQSITIAFGSSAHQDKAQPLLEVAADLAPDAFIFLGGNIYGDTRDMDTLRAKYDQLAGKPEFQGLREVTDVYAIWDDHDYGENDAGRHYPRKVESEQLFLDFWAEPEDSDRREHAGTYGVKYLQKGDLTVQLLLLDTRYFRDDLLRRTEEASAPYKNDYIPNSDPDSTFLGEAQWRWLEERFRVPADVRIIASSNQFGHAYNGWESWTNVPHERQRMLELIERTGVNGVLFISGNVHWGEISKQEVAGGYPIYDVTSSGITETWETVEPNANRVGQAIQQNNIGYLRITPSNSGLKLQLALMDQSAAIVEEQTIKLKEISN